MSHISPMFICFEGKIMTVKVTTETDEFIAAYIEAALWSTTDESREDGGDYLDMRYGRDDIDPASRARIWYECRNFLEAMRPYINGHITQAGHDLWLTRCGHGAGFWDRPELYGKSNSEILTNCSKAMGSRDLVVGDDGRLYYETA